MIGQSLQDRVYEEHRVCAPDIECILEDIIPYRIEAGTAIIAQQTYQGLPEPFHELGPARNLLASYVAQSFGDKVQPRHTTLTEKLTGQCSEGFEAWCAALRLDAHRTQSEIPEAFSSPVQQSNYERAGSFVAAAFCRPSLYEAFAQSQSVHTLVQLSRHVWHALAQNSRNVEQSSYQTFDVDLPLIAAPVRDHMHGIVQRNQLPPPEYDAERSLAFYRKRG